MKARWLVLIVVVIVLLFSIIPFWSDLSIMMFHYTGTITFKQYNPYDGEGTWYKGQLHCHSNRSGGELAPSEVVAHYASLGYQFIAISDHHTVTKFEGGSLLVLGQEYGKGSTESGENFKPHMNGINVSYVSPESASLQARIDGITAQHGIVVLNHPTTLFYAYDMNSLVGLENYTGLEIYNGLSPGILSGDAVSAWDKVLSTGKLVWGVAGDDAHAAKDYGKGWVEVRIAGNLSTAHVVNAIRQGSFYSTQGPMISDLSFNGTTFSVSSPGADSVSFYGQDGRLLKTIAGGDAIYKVEGSEGYVRAEVSQNGLKAWSQPVFLGHKEVPLRFSSISSLEYLELSRTNLGCIRLSTSIMNKTYRNYPHASFYLSLGIISDHP
jgi:hypothetical protein